MKELSAEQRTGLKLDSRQSNRIGNSDQDYHSHACANIRKASTYQSIMAKGEIDFNA